MADLLVDEGIGQDLVQQLRARGFQVFHALEFLPKGARDSLVFGEAQQRHLAVFTYNHKHFVLLAQAWGDWGHGDHFGVITRPIGKHQLPPPQTLQVMQQFCADPASMTNRIALSE